MIRTGTQYLDSICDSREVYVNGERVRDLAQHPMFSPLIDIRARIYDMQHQPTTRELGDSAVIHWFREHPGAGESASASASDTSEAAA
jgi:aromatic ring hydroxylase